jgi:hypothetical protein
MARSSSDPKRRLSALAARWGIETHPSVEFQNFKRRFAISAEDNVLWWVLNDDGTNERFGFLTGFKTDVLGSEYFLTNAKTLPEFLYVAQQLLWAMDECESTVTESFVHSLREAKRYSPGIDFGIVERGGVVTIYPQGARELDKALVEEPLEWLSGFPKIAEHVEEALKILLAKDSGKYRNALDNLRWSLEQLLRVVLSNRKPIEKQPEVLLPWLKQKGVHQQIVNMYLDLLKRFSHYQNDAVKHGDAWKLAEIEMMVYSTGTLMRFLLQVRDEDDVAEATPDM